MNQKSLEAEVNEARVPRARGEPYSRNVLLFLLRVPQAVRTQALAAA
jgi:hypothetical protein